MHQFKIEKNIPCPLAKNKHSKYANYPFPDLDIGDSFFAPYPPAQLTSAAQWWVKKFAGERKFTVRKIDGGCRVWRTE
jgi:hypothetical protein